MKPGTYHVSVTARGWSPYFKEIVLADGEETEVSIALELGLSITGVVVTGEIFSPPSFPPKGGDGSSPPPFPP